MSGTQHASGLSGSLPLDEWRRPSWRIRLPGADSIWAIAFLVPYVGVFVAFVAYPVVFGLWMGHDPALYGLLMSDPRFADTAINTLVFVAIGVNVTMFAALLLSGFFMRRTWWRRLLLAVFLIPWALPGFVVFTSIHFMLVTQWGLLDSLIRAVTGEDGPLFLVSTPIAMASNIVAYIWKWLPFWTLIFAAGRMAIPQDIYDAADIDGATGHKRLIYVTFPLLASVYLICTLLDTVWTLGDYPTVYFVSSGAPARTTDVLATYGVHEAFDFARPYLGVAAMMSALPIVIPVVLLLMRRVRAAGVTAMSMALTAPLARLPRFRRGLVRRTASAAFGIVLLIWTLLPVYNMLLVALDEDGDEFTGAIWPGNPNLDGFAALWNEDTFLLEHFWYRFGNSIKMGLATMVLTVLIGSLASFVLGRMRLRGSRVIGDLALITYVLPTAFLAIPFVHIMHKYGLTDSLWSVIASQVAFATPYAILILHQYGKLIPLELDESAKVDGATPWQIYRRIYVPLMAPALVAVGVYALLLAWNEYLYQYLLVLSMDSATVAVVINQFFNSDEAPWNYMMAIAIVYSLPPIAIYFALRRFMVAGLAMGGVKG